MIVSSSALHFEIHPRRQRPKRQWRRAFRAMRELVRHPDRTGLANVVFDALDPDFYERSLARMLEHPEGRRVFLERPSLLEALTDVDALRRLPEESFGRAYLDHLERYQLDPRKLVELGRATARAEVADPDLRWLAERSQLGHDLWHVLAGYGADELGESALLCFSFAQTGGRSNALLSFGANLRVARLQGIGWFGYAITAWRRGRRAVCLQALPYEKLLPLPLAEVRLAAGLGDPERAHRDGVRRGDPIRSAA